MTEKKSKEKTIKEEMAGNFEIMIVADVNGRISWKVNKNIPTPELVGILRVVIDELRGNMIKDSVMRALGQQDELKKRGLIM